ncbi:MULTISPECIES: DUF4402 domain-containing protein [Fusobacterium]|uniref:DUF4402 domain-containing protein n=1 Tax=Fusobacterium hominis TaxID=2764326 RepID=A0A7G9GWS9_9FUSO|nr:MULTISPECIES: DUF4402 domain-containing protein [Fusobacterium]QNM15261.1 DUF4402 domain-containing protein [Fusobacterium hominis]
MKKFYIFIMFLLSFCVFGKDICIDTNIFSVEKLSIPNGYNPMSIVRAKMEVIIENEDDNPENYFEFSAENIDERMIDRVQVLTQHYYSDPPRYYFRDERGNLLKELRLLIDCYIYCDTRYLRSNTFSCKLGRMNSGNRIFVLCDTKEYIPIHNLKIEVKDNMDLGQICSGGILSTAPGGTGTPAKIVVSGQEGKHFELKIPQSTTITNTKGNDTLKVLLNLRNKYLLPSHKDGKEYTEFIIDGLCKTKNSSYGKYRGSFVVRVEYTDET